MPLDIAIARTNLATEITETRARLTELEQAQALIADEQDERITTLIETLSKYGRKRASAAPPTPLPEGGSLTDLILAVVNSAPRPVRAKDIEANDTIKARGLERNRISQILASLVGSKRVKKMGPGLYSKVAGAKGNGIVDAIAAPKNGAKLNLKTTAAALVTATEHAARDFGKEPFTLAEITKAIEKTGFTFYGDNHEQAVGRAMAAVSKIKRTGHSRGVRYHWRG